MANNKSLLKLINYINTNEKSIDFVSFLFSYTPDLILDDSYARKIIYSSHNDLDKAQLILDCHNTIKYVEENRIHEKSCVVDPYDSFKKVAAQSNQFSKNEFYSVYYSCKYFILNNAGLKTGIVAQNICALSHSNHIHSSDLLSLILNKIMIPLKQSISQDLGILPNDCLLDISFKIENQFIRLIKSDLNSIMDVLCLLSYDEKNSDDIVETKVILHKLNELYVIHHPRQIFIFDARPYFIRQIISSLAFTKSELIISTEHITADILSLLHSNRRIKFIDNKLALSKIADGIIHPDTSLIFANHSCESMPSETINALIRNATNIHNMIIFGHDHAIQLGHIYNEIKDICIKSIDLLPENIPNSTAPKRKSIVHCMYGYITEAVNEISINHYGLSTVSGFPAISQKAFVAKITTKDFIDSKCSIRSMFREQRQKNIQRTSQKRIKSKILSFSPEILFFYTVSVKDGVYRIASRAKISNNSNKPIDIPSTKSSSKQSTIANALFWLECKYPYGKTITRDKGTLYIRDQIATSCKTKFKNSTITLKTFIYIHPEIFMNFPEEARDEEQLWINADISEYLVNEITPELLYDFLITNYQSKKRKISYTKALALFKRLFAVAIDTGNCSQNVAILLYNDRANRNPILSDISSNLTKKFLYLNEASQILPNINNPSIVKHPEDLALILRFSLGLSLNIINALTWKDFIEQSIDNHETFYKLCIRRQLNNDSTEFLSFTARELYRIIPLPADISKLLINVKKYHLNSIAGNNQEYLSNCTIIVGSDNVIDGIARIYSIKRMSYKHKKKLNKLDVPDEILSIPNDHGGTDETNLSYYGSDIFRSNFRHYAAINNGKQNLAIEEYCYVAGLKAPNTFSSNYCDFGNPLAQIKIYQKINNLFQEMTSNE